MLRKRRKVQRKERKQKTSGKEIQDHYVIGKKKEEEKSRCKERPIH